MQSDIVQRLKYWRGEMQRTIKALESNPKFADVVDGNGSIYTTLGMAKTEIEFSRATIANLTSQLRAAEERERDAVMSAYCTGATDVHNSWVEGTNGGEADFGEAASDYYSSIKGN